MKFGQILWMQMRICRAHVHSAEEAAPQRARARCAQRDTESRVSAFHLAHQTHMDSLDAFVSGLCPQNAFSPMVRKRTQPTWRQQHSEGQGAG